MPTPKKEATVAELSDMLSRATLTVVADYRGLKVSEMQAFRTTLRGLNGDAKVAKNTLTAIAARQVGKDGLAEYLAGPTVLINAYGDPVSVAKAIGDFARTSRIMSVKGGVMDNRTVSAADVEAIATLPSREELQAKLLGMLISPMTRTLGVLTGPSRSLVYVLNARAEQQGGAVAAD